MSVWFKPYSIDELNAATDKHLSKLLGITINEIGDDFIDATMPVDDRTKMPFGLLHGGASCVLAESLASYAAYMCVDPKQARVAGLEINANHIKGVSGGYVSGHCQALHCGKSTQVWDVRITNSAKELVCASRVTIAVLQLNS